MYANHDQEKIIHEMVTMVQVEWQPTMNTHAH